MKVIAIICFVLSVFSGFAQDTIKTKKLQYFGLHQVGLLSGSSMNKAGVLTTNGVYFGNWYTGISTGIDWYGIRTIPLLADVHKAFGKSRNQPFVYGNAGVGFVWQDDNTYSYLTGSGTFHYSKGFTGETGLGYFINLRNKTSLSFSVGYSYKRVAVKETNIYFGVDPTLYNTSKYEYNYRRIAIRIGIKI